MNTTPNGVVSKRAKRAAPPPVQASMNSLSEPVQIYKDLTGQKTIAPVVADRIAETVIDLDHWRKVIAAWCSRYDKRNTDGMLDWYLHPAKMAPKERSNGKHVRPHTGPHFERAQWKTHPDDEPV